MPNAETSNLVLSQTMNSPTLKTKVNHLLHKQVKNIKILKSLGSGANATVYLGEVVDYKKHFLTSLFDKHHHHHGNSIGDTDKSPHEYTPGQQVAVKQLHTEDKKHVQQLTEEYCIVSQLNHENIIKVYDLFYDHYWCFISEYAGHDLFQLIEQGMSTSEINKVMKQLFSAAAYLEQNGVCHRDIKPENILCQNDTIKLCDFGLAVRFKSVFDEEDHYIEGIQGSDPYMVLNTHKGT